jgi:two-component system, sensor histidine kinase RegB
VSFARHAVRGDMSWLVSLRWCAIAGQLVTIGLVRWGMQIALPLTVLLGVVGLEVAANVAFMARLRRPDSITEALIAGSIGIDVLLLTALLTFSGGTMNPFNFLYLVHISLAALVLQARLTWALVVMSLLCSASLFVTSSWVPSHHAAHDGIMSFHLEGMWVAFMVSAAFIVYFGSVAQRQRAAREKELDRLRMETERRDKLAALATLAAGAAHELATPLSTIALVAKELERSLVSDSSLIAASADARLIRAEVDRCRGILDLMAADVGQTSGEAKQRTRVDDLVDLALDNVPASDTVEIEVSDEVGARHVTVYPRAFGQALRVLVKNAIEASSDSKVSLRAKFNDGRFEIEVNDRGVGMDSKVLQRAGEPFFTTKPPGEGMGLGLFLARAVIERLDGDLTLTSVSGEGTTATVRLPTED